MPVMLSLGMFIFNQNKQMAKLLSFTKPYISKNKYGCRAQLSSLYALYFWQIFFSWKRKGFFPF